MEQASKDERGTEWKRARRARVEISLLIDEAAYADFYGDDVSDETLQEALAEAHTLIRLAFKGPRGALRLPWYQASVGRVVPVPEVVADDRQHG